MIKYFQEGLGKGALKGAIIFFFEKIKKRKVFRIYTYDSDNCFTYLPDYCIILSFI